MDRVHICWWKQAKQAGAGEVEKKNGVGVSAFWDDSACMCYKKITFWKQKKTKLTHSIPPHFSLEQGIFFAYSRNFLMVSIRIDHTYEVSRLNRGIVLYKDLFIKMHARTVVTLTTVLVRFFMDKSLAWFSNCVKPRTVLIEIVLTGTPCTKYKRDMRWYI